MQFLYNLAIKGYGLGLWFAAIFHAKANKWVKGRREWEASLQAWKNSHDRSPIWIHCASLGEFEQGRSLIDACKQAFPQEKILLTFFSPSGYELRKDYPRADHVCYLPLDTRANARTFIGILQPKMAIFVKYEFWLNLLTELSRRQVPTILISAVFRSDQVFFQPYGRLFREALAKFDRIFLQDKASADLLSRIGIPHYTIAGDTRVDRVLEIAENAPEFPIIKTFSDAHPVLVVGSSWGEDERILLPFLNQQFPENWRVIIAPHEITETNLAKLEDGLIANSCRYSKAKEIDPTAYQVLIIDNIGMLSALYQYGKIAYIGGGFGAGIHNTLEPVAFGLPVLFGPRYTKFNEANRLVETGGAFCVENQEQLAAKFQELQDTGYYTRSSEVAQRYISDHSGSTQKIMAYLAKKILATNISSPER